MWAGGLFDGLFARLFETPGENKRALLFAHQAFKRMAREDRIRACYLHASLRYVQRYPMTNSSLRARLGLSDKSSAVASKVIKETVDDKLIRPLDTDAGKIFMKYIPFGA